MSTVVEQPAGVTRAVTSRGMSAWISDFMLNGAVIAVYGSFNNG